MKIKQILVDQYGWIYSGREGQIEEFFVAGEMANVKWFRKGNQEYNGKYVVVVEYENLK